MMFVSAWSPASSTQPIVLAPPRTDQLANPRVEGHLLPLGFVPNVGQYDPNVAFQGMGFSGSLFFSPSEIVWLLGEPTHVKNDRFNIPPSRSHSEQNGPTRLVRLRFLDASHSVQLLGQDLMRSKMSFFLGSDPTQWHDNVGVYGALIYRQIYLNIDLRLEITHDPRGIKGTYLVFPGANPKQIRWRYGGDVIARLDVGVGTVNIMSKEDGVHLWTESSPRAWQETERGRFPVRADYTMDENGNLGFRLGWYDPRYPLIIDPFIEFSTYLGGSGSEGVGDLAVDLLGNVYLTGFTNSADFPTTIDPGSLSATGHVFVTKLSPDGQEIIYSVILGGSGLSSGSGIAVDSAENVYLTGETTSPDFPIVQPLQSTLGGDRDAFVTVLNPSAENLLFSSYIGGDQADIGEEVEVKDNIIVGGLTYSSNFPTTSDARDRLLGGGSDGFILAIDRNNFSLGFSTYFGGSDLDSISDLAVGKDGSIYVAGVTYSRDLPTMNPLQPFPGSPENCSDYFCADAFVAQLAPDGTTLQYSTYLGGSSADGGTSLAVDSLGNIYIAGTTGSGDFPTTRAIQPEFTGGYDIFVSKISKSGNVLLYSTYLGGFGDESVLDIVIDSEDRANIVGYANSCIPALSYRQLGAVDGVFILLSPGGDEVEAYALIGGTGSENINTVALDAEGNIFLAGSTDSPDFPLVNALDSSLSGGQYVPDAFVMKVRRSLPLNPPPGERSVYLPIIYGPEPRLGIFGYVTSHSCGAGGISLELRFFNGSEWSTLATTVSAEDGFFSFPNAPSLAQGQKYYVRFVNDSDSKYVGAWGTYTLDSYQSGSNVFIGDFDISDVGLLSPDNGASLRLPITFSWGKRLYKTDSYEYNLFDYFNPALSLRSNPLGYVDSFTLQRRPPGFNLDTYYLWYVGVYDPDGGYGFSFYARWIKFSSSGASIGPLLPLPPFSKEIQGYDLGSLLPQERLNR